MKSFLTPSARSTAATWDRSSVAILFSAWILVAVIGVAAAHGAGNPDPSVPAITVNGSGEVSAAPDRAVVSLGAVVEAKQAVDAQKQLAQVMQRVLKDIKALGISDEKIRTSGLSLQPMYSHPAPRAGQEPEAPRIVGYRASNTVRVQVDDIERIGSVIDAGITAGANQLTGLSFELKDDLKYRQQALKIAAQEARSKAEAIAAALNLQLGEVLDVREEGAHVPHPVERRLAAPAAVGTPIQPGQVQVTAAVSVRFKFAGPRQ
jgi:uncharacterized protein YggE